MNERTKKLTTVAMLCAIAYVVMAVGRIPVVLFLKYEPKDVIITIGGFIYGPLTACTISVIVSFVEMLTVSDTGFIGLAMNILSSCTFACTASFIYKKKHTLPGAVYGLVTGWLLTTAIMLLWNYFITPIYMGYPRDAVAQLLIPVFLPFNLLKGALNGSFTLLLYKPLVNALRKSNLVPTVESNTKTRNIGIILVSSIVVITCVLLVLVMQKII
ncbi:MAG: ECF transporter S component [Clostridiaceae bacterium]|nr:ECF transporter S component [Clostridiaceae bacterium]